jgi:hypothetical protein
MAVVEERTAQPEQEVIEAEIIGARIIEPKIVDGRIVGGRIVGGRVVTGEHPREKARRVRHIDREILRGEMVALAGLAMVIFVMLLWVS